ncbi:MAG TPA: sulfite exporter TauE/SafE family protein [Gemmatimonas sp.]|nr:sulfite exporter TauE/SafE family protein [Gemmatimonas sp.]
MTTILLLLAIGLGAGVLSGMFGIGGGILIVPGLVILMKLTQQQASATSLAALVIPIYAALGAYRFHQSGVEIDFKHAVLLAVGMAGGVLIGQLIATSVDGAILRRAFAVLLVFTAYKMWNG